MTRRVTLDPFRVAVAQVLGEPVEFPPCPVSRRNVLADPPDDPLSERWCRERGLRKPFFSKAQSRKPRAPATNPSTTKDQP
jgi:hypothetical protein